MGPQRISPTFRTQTIVELIHVFLYLWHDMAQGVHDALLKVVEDQTTLSDAAHNAGEVVV